MPLDINDLNKYYRSFSSLTSVVVINLKIYQNCGFLAISTSREVKNGLKLGSDFFSDLLFKHKKKISGP